MSLQIPKRQFNVDEYYRMAESGILSERDRVELIEGEVIEMNPIGTRHFSCVVRLTSLLTERLGTRFYVSIQGPVRIDDFSQPEPDVAVLTPRGDFYADSLPGPEDVLLLIEVADSSLDYDREVKKPLYAKAGVAEFWLVDLAARTIDCYWQPSGDEFQRHERRTADDRFESVSIPELSVAVSEILG